MLDLARSGDSVRLQCTKALEGSRTMDESGGYGHRGYHGLEGDSGGDGHEYDDKPRQVYAEDV